MKEDSIVCFHYCKTNGYFGKVFVPNIHKLQDLYDDQVFIYDSNEDGNPIRDEDWTLTNCMGHVLISGKDKIQSPVGTLDLDDKYDTYVVKYIKDCDNDELELIAQKAYDSEDDEALAYALEKTGLLVAKSVLSIAIEYDTISLGIETNAGVIDIKIDDSRYMSRGAIISELADGFEHRFIMDGAIKIAEDILDARCGCFCSHKY